MENTRPTRPIEVPYEGDQELVIEPGVRRHHDNPRENLMWLFSTDTNIEELDRIFRATVILHAADAGTFEECLHQAIVWERG